MGKKAGQATPPTAQSLSPQALAHGRNSLLSSWAIITTGFAKIIQWWSKYHLRQHIKDPELVKKLTPQFPLGAKRILFSDTYYPALTRPNVEVLTNGVQSITTDGVITGNGISQSIDALIYATGFKSNPFLMGLDIRGKNGLTIRQVWQSEPVNYLGITTHHFPNLFMMYGPNTNLGHNSIILMSEAQADYIAQCVAAIKHNNWHSVEVKQDIMNTYHTAIQQASQKHDMGTNPQ